MAVAYAIALALIIIVGILLARRRRHSSVGGGATTNLALMQSQKRRGPCIFCERSEGSTHTADGTDALVKEWKARTARTEQFVQILRGGKVERGG